MANALRARFEVFAVCYQDTGYVPADTAAGTIDDPAADAVRHHFQERRRQETAYFGHDADPGADSAAWGVRTVGPAGLNTADTLALLRDRQVETVVVCGTGLIKSPLLEAYARRMLNLHLGLSPYYRGTATNFYPLLNDEPEYVGATIHLINPGIDTGPIVHHARPEIAADHMPYTVGCKVILAGIEKLIRAVDELAAGMLNSVPRWPVQNPRLYLRKD